MTGWLQDRIAALSKQAGYEKPKDAADAAKMNSNENFAIPRQFQQDVLRGMRGADMREYPRGRMDDLISAISENLGVPASCIGLGNGSDHILDLILGSFASRRTKVLAPDPAFSFFEQRCRLYSVPMIRVPFSDDMTLDADMLLERSKGADILYLDSPNNPTGYQIPKKEMMKIAREFDGMIILDEAYADFGEYSMAKAARKSKNIVLVRTFSKSHGLAGLRIGYFVSGAEFARVFSRVVQYPYPINAAAIEAAIAALGKSDQIRSIIGTIRQERSRIIAELRRYDAFEVFDSNANFVLFDAKGAYKRVSHALLEQGIAIREIGSVAKRRGCLRVTVGAPEANSKFLLAIRDLLG